MPFTRRDFTRLGAAGVASQLFPAFPRLLHAEGAAPADGDKKIGYAIIGLGRIADHFMRGIQQTSNSKVTGLVSGHPDKAARIAEKYGVPKDSIYNYQNMDEMKNNPLIDAVYVALPNGMHAEYTIRSAKAGKHVLCEKPMCSTVSEAEAMIAACNEAKVKLMIAYRCHYETTNLRAVKLIRDGAIGKIQQINSVFGFRQTLGEWRLDKALAGGGPMMDVGIYCLNATRYLTGEEPAEISAYTYTDKSDPLFQKGVEANIGWVTKFPSGVVAACNTTYASQMEGYFHVYGSKGWLHVEPAFSYEKLRLNGVIATELNPHQNLDEANPEKDPHQFANEADHFSDCVLNNKTPKTPGEEGLQDLKLIRQIYHSVGIDMA